MGETSHNEHSVEIEKEKTKRTFAYLGVFGVLGLVAIVLFYLNVGQGSLKVSTDGIEVTVDKPLIDQVESEQQSITVNGDTVAMTTGTVPDSVVEKIEAKQSTPLSNDTFVGKNLIDRTQGFVVSTERPDAWKIDPVVLASDTKVLSIRTQAGSRVRADTIPASRCQDLRCAIRLSTRDAVGSTDVKIDRKTSTAVVTFTDRQRRTVVVKLLHQDDHWVTVRGEVAPDASDSERKDVIKTVTTFSLIAKK